MQKEILKALSESPRMTKEFSTYLRALGIDVNKFILEDNLPNKMYYFVNLFTDLYNLDIIFRSNQISIAKSNIEIMYFSRTINGSNYIEKMICEIIKYCEKPF